MDWRQNGRESSSSRQLKAGISPACTTWWSYTRRKLCMLPTSSPRIGQRRKISSRRHFYEPMKKIQGFDPARPFRPWFLRVVINEAIKTGLAREKGNVPLSEETEYLAVIRRLDLSRREPEEAIQRKELVEAMRSALHRLSPAQRAAVVMHYFLGLSTVQAAEQLNCAPGTLRWHLSVARERLRSLLFLFK